ncbi:hypothetical protein [Phaeodactylibacter xiamenensis]|uniref:hypothetical protein n=1 Tax=Phaeodactylibacter xiamenensis TaxID=1524460 RepID=UPI003CCC24C4
MKLIITSILTILTFSVFAQVKVNGVEIPENIKIIEAGVMEYKSIDKYAIIIDYGQQEGVWLVQPPKNRTKFY